MFVTVKQAAKLTGLSERLIRQGIQKGHIPYYRSGRRLVLCVELVRDTIMQQMIDNQKATADEGANE